MKKYLLIETTLLSAFVAVLMVCASLSTNNSDENLAVNDIQSSAQGATHASTSYHSIYKFRWSLSRTIRIHSP